MATKIKVKYEEIRNSSLFAGVPDKIIKKIISFPKAQEHPAGHTIIKEGDVGEFMFVVLSGQVDVIKNVNNKEIVVATLPPGAFVGEGALVSGAPRNATVKANTPVKIAYFDRQAYNKMITIDPIISSTLMKVHKERCKDTLKKVNFAKSKAFLITAGVAVLPIIQVYLPMLPHVGDIFKIMPPAVLALLGPGGAALAFKFQKSDMAGLVGKLDKL
jgi:signal-transduction protein with cAMP-binding, CBS, and nucleotidyltransferase domain